MKKILAALLFCSAFTTQAQLQVGSSMTSQMNHPGKISKSEFEQLKATKTVFVLQESDFAFINDYEKAIKKVWTVTPFEIIHFRDLSKYATNPKYSVFCFDAFTVISKSTTSTHISYSLWIGHEGRKSKLIRDQFARIILHPAGGRESEVTSVGFTDDDKSDFINAMFNKAEFSNWGPGFLMGYLGEINHLLKDEEVQGMYTETHDFESLKALKNDTLYIPDYVQVHFNKFTGAERVDEDKDDESLAESYPYPIKMVSAVKLNKMIVAAQKPMYYLVYAKSSTDKFISVYSTENFLIYSNYKAASYNFKNKDMKILRKNID